MLFLPFSYPQMDIRISRNVGIRRDLIFRMGNRARYPSARKLAPEGINQSMSPPLGTNDLVISSPGANIPPAVQSGQFIFKIS